MKRYAICPVIGSGIGEDFFRAKVPAGMNHVAVIPLQTPIFPWALVEVSGANLSALDADAEVDAFPSVLADTMLSSLSKAVQNRIQDVLQRRGVVFSPTSSSTVGDVIDAIGTYLDGNFSRGRMFIRDDS